MNLPKLIINKVNMVKLSRDKYFMENLIMQTLIMAK
jgi:hypothetical protein